MYLWYGVWDHLYQKFCCWPFFCKIKQLKLSLISITLNIVCTWLVYFNIQKGRNY